MLAIHFPSQSGVMAHDYPSKQASSSHTSQIFNFLMNLIWKNYGFVEQFLDVVN